MPKVPKNKKKTKNEGPYKTNREAYNINVILRDLRKWKKAAEDVSTIAAEAYKRIRGYISRYERMLTDKQLEILIESVRM